MADLDRLREGRLGQSVRSKLIIERHDRHILHFSLEIKCRVRRSDVCTNAALASCLRMNRLREARKFRGLTQPALAERAGLAQQLISKLERKKYLDLEYAERLSKALNVHVLSLLVAEIPFTAESLVDFYSEDTELEPIDQQRADRMSARFQSLLDKHGNQIADIAKAYESGNVTEVQLDRILSHLDKSPAYNAVMAIARYYDVSPDWVAGNSNNAINHTEVTFPDYVVHKAVVLALQHIKQTIPHIADETLAEMVVLACRALVAKDDGETAPPSE